MGKKTEKKGSMSFTANVKADLTSNVKDDVKDDGTFVPSDMLTEEDISILNAKEASNVKVLEELSGETRSYDNGFNKWVLISKTHNNLLGWEHITMAMSVRGGILVNVKEAINDKISSSTVFISGGILEDIKNVDCEIDYKI